jgi:hypothetical protein
MNQLAPLSLSQIQALVAVAGERAPMRFLEFFAANILQSAERGPSRALRSQR